MRSVKHLIEITHELGDLGEVGVDRDLARLEELEEGALREDNLVAGGQLTNFFDAAWPARQSDSLVPVHHADRGGPDVS